MPQPATALGGELERAADSKPVRCGIYTRKSTSVGLDQDFNSLDAQRAACEGYINQRVGLAWRALDEAFEDGGFTGANLDRPGMQRLLADVDTGLIDVVVVYKVNRLSRSLLDFARMMARFQESGTAFVSVTQNFSTADAMGRLTLNMLMSFAEFEREMISERTRDKMAAARQRGKWTGGPVPYGYQAVDKKLVVDEQEAVVVREIFALYLEHGSALHVAQLLNEQGRTKRPRKSGSGALEAKPWNQGNILLVLKHPLYIGRIRSGGETYPGEHDAIIGDETFERAGAILSGKVPRPIKHRRDNAFLLRGLLRCAHCGRALTPVTARPRGRRYRYYRCVTHDKMGREACPARQLPAGAMEEFVVNQIREAATDLAAAHAGKTDWLSLTLRSFDDTWPHLTLGNRQRLIHAIVKRVEVDQVDGEMTIELNEADDLGSAELAS